MRKLLLFLAVLLSAYASNATCTASFTHAAAPTATSLYNVNFTNTSTFTGAPGTAYPTYGYSFGDGSTQSYVWGVVGHNYAAAGTYTVKLYMRLTDSLTNTVICTDTATQTITVTAPPCASTISLVYPSGNTGAVTLTANTPAGTSGMTYYWNFGDGNVATGNPVTHTYASFGYYTVRLVATNGSCADTVYQSVNPITCNGVHATFNPLVSGNTVVFQNTSSAPSSAQFAISWNFGDGTSSNAWSPTHTYTTAGTHYVTLIETFTDTLTNLVCTDSMFQSVTTYSTGTGCPNNHATFYTSQSGNTVTFHNTSTSGNPGQAVNYVWNFGDGSAMSSAANPVHTYPAGGTYTARLSVYWVDSTVTGQSCFDSVSHIVTIQSGNPCAGHYASFASGPVSGGYQFYNYSPNFPNQVQHANWYFGDGTSAMNVLNPTHTYAAAGSYYATLEVRWTDSNNNVICVDSLTHQIQVSNIIDGYVKVDSTNNPSIDSFKVWLIQYDSLSNTLSAVDSMYTSGSLWSYYSFSNKPAGVYYTKAKMLDQTVGSSGYVPTYHEQSLYWSTATAIYHNGLGTVDKHIRMQHGVVTSGPGFISGNISAGANKGTGTGIAGIIVYLRDYNNQLVASAYTDVNGDFSFNNIPLGTYSLYPESMNYITTPIANITITSAQPSASGYRFGQTANEIKPKATGVENVTKATYLLYPNPANNKVIVRWGDVNGTANIVITDIAGHKVYQSENVKMSGNTEINVSSLQSGLYFIKVESGNTQEVTKLAIQH
ncbi:PKD domain-containing protein [Taibaiella soli]|uniref:PKD domain-containing protein n=1 Tax=Taibaiella soli TaxID=1649169 RepID=A0A2W2ATJ6_9BACT|nr:PKD domain-containing protein [Taibaiella soli]PZF71028.1 hypothetical protein DN068_20205 [Taibaiella soli]